MLGSAGILNVFKVVFKNEDVLLPKPSPIGYLLACEKLGLDPSRVLVIEDGDYGIEAAREAGCQVIRVNNPTEVNLGLLLPYIPELI
jgi:sugar-phosphatase